MSRIALDIKNKTGNRIRPLHGMNSGPVTKVFTYDCSQIYKELGVKHCRLHDVEYPYGSGEFVDIPNLFKNFDADENDPANYNFALTDLYIQKIIDIGAEPLFRLGVSIEHPATEFGAGMRVYPPKDFEKWARICEHVIAHYTEGWANGYNWKIEYWEIWNEADGSRNMDIDHKNQWCGTPEEFYRFYAVAARHLKKRFPHLKIGGPAFTSPVASNEFVNGFFRYLKAENEKGDRIPMDFFSWHRYFDKWQTLYGSACLARKHLDESGYHDSESVLDEWNLMKDWNDQAESYVKLKDYRGAVFCAAVLAGLQSKTDVSLATYFEGDVVKEWCGIMDVGKMRLSFPGFKAVPKVLPPFYAFRAFNDIFKLENELKIALDDERILATGAEKDGKWGILIANETDEDITLDADFKNINANEAVVYLTDKTNTNTPVMYGLEEKITLPHCSFVFITNLYTAKLTADFSETSGKIRPLHGVNEGPMTKVFTYDARPQFKELGIPFCRLHDTEYPYGSGEFVDIPNIFKNFDADVDDPASYSFRLTDIYIEKIIEVGAEPLFRLGVSIEHAPKEGSTREKFLALASRINPPKDYDKWARICEHIIRHYTEGWANGYNWKMNYWEILNEPEGRGQWTGTPEQAYELYCVTARHLKACFPHLKIGGCGFTQATNSFVTGFFDYLDNENKSGPKVPLDFFSWHSYYEYVETPVKMAAIARRQLNDHGYHEAESIFDEWNYSCREESNSGEKFRAIKDYRGASHCAATLAALQSDTDVSAATYFEGDVVKEWCGLFDVDQMFIGYHGHKATVKPLPPYYAFYAFNELYKLGNCVKLTKDCDAVHACAAANEHNFGILIGNEKREGYSAVFDFNNLNAADVKVYMTDENHNFELVSDKLPQQITLKARSFVFITGTR